jgi:hypothetical protein
MCTPYVHFPYTIHALVRVHHDALTRVQCMCEVYGIFIIGCAFLSHELVPIIIIYPRLFASHFTLQCTAKVLRKCLLYGSPGMSSSLAVRRPHACQAPIGTHSSFHEHSSLVFIARPADIEIGGHYNLREYT